MSALDEEDDLPLDISEDLVPQPAVKPSDVVDLSFSGLLAPPLRLQTNRTECGGQLWPAGMVLADFLLRQHKDNLKGKTIVELGAGSGLVGLAIALGLYQSISDSVSPTSSSLHLTDGLPALIPLLWENIHLNFSKSSASIVAPRAALLRWGQVPDAFVPGHPDVILAADCAYLEESFPLLVKTLEHMMGQQTVLWFCYKKRRKRDRDCIKMIGKVFDVLPVKGIWENDGIWLFDVRRNR